MSDLAIAIVTTLGAGGLGGAVLKYLLDRRRSSGRVDTVEAKTIFRRQEEELAAARAFMMEQFHLRDIEIAGLKEMSSRQAGELRTKDAEIARLTAKLEQLAADMQRKDERIGHLEADVERKDRRIQTLEQDREELRARVRELERIDEVRVAAARKVDEAHNSPQGTGL